MSQPHHTEAETDTKIAGVRVAVVRDNEDPEDIGRVKLEYPWRDADDESHWARIATEMTGDDYGTYYLPEVGDEVEAGKRYGLIRFGSRVDVYLPKESEILASVGDKTSAGETILGYLR